MTDHSTYVVSCGASGSKVFSRFLYPGENFQVAAGRHLHTRDPGAAPANARRFVYLFSDPRDSVVSFFQRRQAKHSNHGFASQTGPRRDWEVCAQNWVRNHMENLGCEPADIDEDWGLQEYLQNSSRDVFQLEEHFGNWLAEDSRQVLFVRYETMWRHEQELIRILGLSGQRLPAFAPRAANWQGQDVRTRSKLEQIYGGFAAKLDRLPGIFGNYGDAGLPETGQIRETWFAGADD